MKCERIVGLWASLAILATSTGVVANLPGPVSAPDAAALCERAAEYAAARTGVPLLVLQAITLAETGRKEGASFRPWPWTVNMEGEGRWFATYPEARAYVEKEFARGARSFDVGCFQINFRWHGEAFRTIDQMFDPGWNALYAGRYLAELYAESGSWKAAAGAYHSRTKEFSEKYAARFQKIHDDLARGGGQAPLAGTAMLAEFFPPPGQSATAPSSVAAQPIPDIPDIVAILNGGSGGGRTARPARVNTYPLLQGAAATGAPARGAVEASLFAAAAPPSGFSGAGSAMPARPAAEPAEAEPAASPAAPAESGGREE